MAGILETLEKTGVRSLKVALGGLGVFVGRAHRLGWLPDTAVVTEHDVAYTAEGRRQAIDVYLPEARPLNKQGHPWVFFIHGGAWATGSRQMGAAMGRILARKGIATVSVGYRLGPRFDIDMQLQDLHSAMAFVHANGARWSLDLAHFAIAGESAGGHLTLRLCQTYPDDLPRPSAVVGIYGLYDFHAWRNSPGSFTHLGARFLVGQLVKASGHEDFFDRHHAHKPLPWNDVPVLLLHGEADKLVPVAQSRSLAALLRAEGVDVRLVTWPGVGHAFNYAVMGREPRAVDFYRTLERFLGECIVQSQ